MLAYVLSNEDLTVKDLAEFEAYSINRNIDCGGKSTIETVTAPDIENDDIVVCRDGNDTLFVGIGKDISDKEENRKKITLAEPECFFDMEIFVGTDSVIASTGLEDFIAAEITANWISSGDAMLDKSWLTVRCLTHTRISAKAAGIGSVTDGVYNFKTFLGNCKEQYGVVIDLNFDENQSGICVDIKKDSSVTVPIDTKVSDVVNPVEEYSVDVLAKLIVRWKNTTTSAVSTTAYYLKSDRTVTTNASDPDRAKGTVKSVYIEAASQAEMQETALKEFANNSYNHKISFLLNRNSRAYPAADYYVGRKVRIRTRNGVKETIVTARSEESGSGFVSLVFGKLKVTMTEKIRGKFK